MTQTEQLAPFDLTVWPSWMPHKGIWGANFAADEYWADGDVSDLPSTLALTRASKALHFDSDGDLQEFANDTLARLDGIGAHVRKQVLNKIRNPRLENGGGHIDGVMGIRNLFLRSNQHGTGWAATRASVTENATNDDAGNLTADKIVENTDNNSHNISQQVAVVAGTTYSRQVKAKKGERSWLRFSYASGFITNADVWFDLDNGVVGTVQANGGTPTIEDAGNGYWLCKQSVVAASSGNHSAFYALADADGSTSYAGDGTSGLYVCKSQIEPRAFVTDYWETTTAIGVNNGAQYWEWEDSANSWNLTFTGGQSENNIPAALVRVQNVDAQSRRISFEAKGTNIAAAPGEAWGLAVPVKLAAGSLSNLEFSLELAFRASNGTTSTGVINAPFVPTTGDLESGWFEVKGVAPSSTAYVEVYIRFTRSGAGGDATLLIGSPLLCKIDAVEGSERVSNGGFADASGWTLSEATITGGKLEINATSASNVAITTAVDGNSVIGEVYKISWEISAISGGQIRAAAGGTQGAVYSTTGTKTDYVLAGASGSNLAIQRATSSPVATVDNFSVKRVTAGYMPHFPVLPPVGAPAESTRLQDSLETVVDGSEPFPGFLDAGLDAGFSVLLTVNLENIVGSSKNIIYFGDGTSSERADLYITTTQKIEFDLVTGGVVRATPASTETITTGRKRIAITMRPGLHAVAATGITSFSHAYAGANPDVERIFLGLRGHNSAAPFDNIFEDVQVCDPLSLAQLETWVSAL